MVGQFLKGFGVHLDVVGDGLEAVTASVGRSYDLIFMDSRMPVLDGLQATREIRSRGGRLADIPIIAFTANAFPEDVQACLAAGMDDFVAKPVQREVFLNATVSALAKRRADFGNDVETARLECAETQTPFDRAAIGVLIDALGPESARTMLTLFIEETKARLARMNDRQCRPTTLQREAHTLKGGAASAGAPLLSALAAALEQALRAGEPVVPNLTGLEAAFAAFRAGLADSEFAITADTA